MIFDSLSRTLHPQAFSHTSKGLRTKTEFAGFIASRAQYEFEAAEVDGG